MKNAILIVVLVIGVLGCEREDRPFHVDRALARAAQGQAYSELQPGQKTPMEGALVTYGEYQETAFAISEGQRLFRWFNCSGCHGNGGGGMGPPLMDAKWIYGSDPKSIYTTIVQGRVNGMPSFRGRLTEFQVWQLVAYVRSISGLVRRDATSSRTDHMKSGPNPTLQDKPTPFVQ
jgi:cytochrome c oxidase cbb3-type subunit 3